MSDCLLCGRCFGSCRALQQHFQSKHAGCYCARCRQTFSSKSAKQQHIRNSTAHFVCRICSHKPDFLSAEELEEHSEAKHNHCTPCERSFNTHDQLVKHNVVEHNMCETCLRYFESVSNLKNHLKTHAEKTIECPGCIAMFISQSAMVLHLEAGTCESGTNWEWIDEIAFDCYQSEWYTCENNPEFDFECPTCNTPFRYMSGLLQHAESKACSENLAKSTPLGKFLRYLRVRLG